MYAFQYKKGKQTLAMIGNGSYILPGVVPGGRRVGPVGRRAFVAGGRDYADRLQYGTYWELVPRQFVTGTNGGKP
jgi:hypothetical protein